MDLQVLGYTMAFVFDYGLVGLWCGILTGVVVTGAHWQSSIVRLQRTCSSVALQQITTWTLLASTARPSQTAKHHEPDDSHLLCAAAVLCVITMLRVDWDREAIKAKERLQVHTILPSDFICVDRARARWLDDIAHGSMPVGNMPT